MALFSEQEIAALTGGVRPPAPKNYCLPTQFPSFRGAKRIAIDLESQDPSIAKDLGPGWRRDAYIVGFSVAIQGKDGSIPFSEYYPIGHKVGPNLDQNKALQWLEDELLWYQGDIVGANLLYPAG